MEIEMKYTIDSKETADRIWDDEGLLLIAEENSREKVYMKAAYFDTEDSILAKNDIAFRVRMEGSRVVASLKWNGESDNGLHTREEINVPVADEACFIMPDPSIFKESESGRAMLEILANKPLHNVLETRFLRSKMKVDTGTSISEVAIDLGEIVTDFGNEQICELEIELFTGDEASIMELGSSLAEKYHLTPQNESKYARGLRILNL